MSQNSLHLLAVLTVFIVVCVNNKHFVIGQNAAEQCHIPCQFAYNFYSRFISSIDFLNNVYDSCVRKRCPNVTVPQSPSTQPTTKTTTTPTTTTTSKTTTTKTRTTPNTTTTPTTTTTTPTTTTTTTTQTTTKTTTTTSKWPVILGCGLQTQSRVRIVGGSPADECEYPWMVSVNIGARTCGGSILDNRHILTAAHCVRWVGPSQVLVGAGSSQYRNLRNYTVLKVNADPRYNQNTKDYDVAVLTLYEDLHFDTCVAPVCLPSAYEDPRDADLCVVAGWGVQSLFSRSRSEALQAVQLPIVDQDACRSSYGIYSRNLINDLKFCAGDFNNGGVDSCQGDSGGPLMCKIRGRYTIYGIVSAGRGCAQPRFPGIYARVSHPNILNFILNATKDTY